MTDMTSPKFFQVSIAIWASIVLMVGQYQNQVKTFQSEPTFSKLISESQWWNLKSP